MSEVSYASRRLCELQACVFEASLRCSDDGSAVFVRRFMRSDLARRLDAAGAELEFADADQMVREVDAEYGGAPYGSLRFSADELHWMGYLYRYWCCMTGEPSKAVYKAIGARELRSLFFAYHSLDPALAVDRIRDAKGLLGPDEVSRGVELLRVLRAAH